MTKYIKKKALKDAIANCTWYHINSKGELVEGANSNDDEPLYKYTDIKRIIKGLPTKKIAEQTNLCEHCQFKGLSDWCDTCRHAKTEQTEREGE